MDNINKFYNNIINRKKPISYLIFVLGLVLLSLGISIDEETIICDSKILKISSKIIQYIGLTLSILFFLVITDLLNVEKIKINLIMYVFIFLIIGILLFISGMIIQVETYRENCKTSNSYIVWTLGFIIISFCVLTIYYFSKNNIYTI